MQFLSLVVLLERIAGINANRRQMKEAILAEQFRRWKDESKWTAEQFYSVIRLLVPFVRYRFLPSN
jgi:hypothetical protein